MSIINTEIKQKVLVISTDATRTGTPILLLRNLEWMKCNSHVEFILVLREGGALLDDFRKIMEVYVLNDFYGRTKSHHLVSRILRKIFFRSNTKSPTHKLFHKLSTLHKINLIYSNSARNGDILKIAKTFFSVKVLTHVHEGLKTLQLWNHNGDVDYNLQSSDEIISVSETVKEMLVKKFLVKKKIFVIPGGINPELFDNEIKINPVDLEQSSDVKIVMCCGWLGWHKGTDYFIQIAKGVCNANDNIHFIWLGGKENDENYKQLMFDIHQFGLESKVKIISEKNNQLVYLSKADVILILSREESFSLVTLEAAMLNKPVLFWDKVGGPAEIANYDERFMVPYGNMCTMQERILNIFEHLTLSVEMASFLKDRVMKNYTVEINAPKILHRIISLTS